MRVAYDAKRLFHNNTGLGNYSRSLVRAMRKQFQDMELFLFSPKAIETSYNEFLSDDYKVVDGGRRLFWREKGMVSELVKLKPEIYHGLSNELPLGIRNVGGIKSIVTIHDLIFLRHPEWYSWSDRLIYTEKFRRACRDADHIIAVSEATKADIIKYFGTSSSKISVVYQSCAAEYYKDFDIGLSENYGLFVSTLTPRKNLDGVIEAMRHLSKKERPLIKVVGEGGSYGQKLKDKIQAYDLEDFFEFLDGVSNNLLIELYRKALFTIYPSFYEGFGIPIVESLLSGTPVIASNRSSMPEAAMDFGLLVDPEDSEEIAEAIISIQSAPFEIDSKKIEQVRDKFSLENQATGIKLIYESVLKS